MSADHDREQLRRGYLPKRVRLLFVGESAPASGRFFYQGDSGLYRALRDAFHAIDPGIDDRNFLDRFQALGCYLTDLCVDPVDDLPMRPRREACRQGEGALVKSIRDHQPLAIVVLLRSIEPNVRRAVLQAEWTGELVVTPYPGRWKHHQQRFREIAGPVLRSLL